MQANLHISFDGFLAALETKFSAVQTQVIATQVVPVESSVIFVVIGSVFVGLLNEFDRVFFGKAGAFQCIFQKKICIRIDEYADGVRIVFQNEVRTSADDDTGIFIGQILDDLSLIIEQILIRGKSVTLGRNQLALIDMIHLEEGIDADAFIHLGKEAFVDAAVFGGHGDDLTFIAVHIQVVCQHLSDCLAAAAILARDGNDWLIHV